ncbi:MAG TPA: sugar transferase [Bacteroidales bacterium]|nr:sugar transferase [Bacteroidales bacterium]
MRKSLTSFSYAACDFIFSAVAWVLLCIIRDRLPGEEDILKGLLFIRWLVFLPLVWTIAYLLTGFHTFSLKRSRLMELVYSLSVTLAGAMVIFFILLMQGFISNNNQYFNIFIIYFFLQFVLTYVPRLTITSITAGKVHRGQLGYRTLIIGSNGLALETFRRIKEEKIPSGSLICGYVRLQGGNNGKIADSLGCLGTIDDLPEIIRTNGIEEVIIAIEGNEHEMTGKITGMLNYSDVTVKAIPSMKDILTGRVEHTAIYGTPFLEVSNRLMPVWQANLKQLSDYIISLAGLIILSPLIAVLAVLIRLSGPGPVIYRQERIGKNGKPFTIYKLRSMLKEAEKGEPLLSSSADQRVTKIGRFMRRHRLDEIPNLFNVLKGEMSLVGPRPERQFYIDQIVAKAPHYRRLLKVKPGITSWGQVKYGYASDVDQMVQRLEYDLLYLENMSLSLDLKIIIYTGIIILNGKGV